MGGQSGFEPFDPPPALDPNRMLMHARPAEARTQWLCASVQLVALVLPKWVTVVVPRLVGALTERAPAPVQMGRQPTRRSRPNVQ